MSASAPKTQASKPPLEKEESKAPWIGLSVLLHVLILAWLIYLVPVRELASSAGDENNPQSPAATAASPELVKEVSQQIEATQAEEVRNKVEEMRSTEKMLAELQAQNASEFAALAKELSSTAPQQAADAQAEANKAQAEAEQAQAEAVQLADALKKMVETPPAPPAETTPSPAPGTPPTPSPTGELKAKVAAAQEKAKTAQAKASAAQTAATQQLEFREDASFKEAKTAQQEAITAQEEANRKQDEATSKINSLSAQQKAAQQAEDAATNAQKQATNEQARSEALKKSIAQQEELSQKQQANLEAMKQRADAAKPAVTKEIAKMETAVTSANSRLDKTKTDLQKNETKAAETQAKADAAKAETEKQKAAATATPAQALALQDEALKAQQKASAAQAKAQETIAQANEKAASGQASTPDTASSETTAQPESLEGKSFEELYKTAVATEKQIAEKFQDIRATQVAVQRKIPISEARKYVELTTPTRPEFNGKKADEIASAAELEKQNAAIEEANQQVDSMVALSRSIAFQANNSGSSGNDPGVAVSLANMQADAAQEEQLAEMATAGSEEENAVDLTEIMKQITGEATPPVPHEHGPGNGPPIEGNGAGNAAAGNGAMKGSGQGRGFPGMGDVRASIPGRKVHAASYGTGDKWMFLDSWYIIGPFPNPQRRNIDTKFPPESIIDLDATYPVEGNTLRWQFIQSPIAGISPPLGRSYAIYYAYTTLWFDEPMDLWTATGSDDFSKVWVNDLMVWASGPIQKVWKPDEGFRKVHFKKGLNRVLVRLENGQNACMFSFMINMQTASK